MLQCLANIFRSLRGMLFSISSFILLQQHQQHMNINTAAKRTAIQERLVKEIYKTEMGLSEEMK